MGKYIAQVEDHLILPALVRLPVGDEQSRRRAGTQVPVPVPIRLLIDTGSKRTTLIPGIFRHLDPRGGNPVRVAAPLRVGTTQLFWVRLDFPEAGLTPFELVQVARLAMPPDLAQFHGLLGRDLLRRLDEFNYQGRRGATPCATRPVGWAGCAAGYRSAPAPLLASVLGWPKARTPAALEKIADLGRLEALIEALRTVTGWQALSAHARGGR